MNMVMVYLKAVDEATIIANVSADFRATIPDPADPENSTIEIWANKPGHHYIYCIGPIKTQEATYSGFDENGYPIEDTPAVFDNNFHANVFCTQDIADQIDASIKITAPNTPCHCWS